MDSRTGPFGAVDPTQLWSQWFDAGTRMWNDVMQGKQESFLDPYGLYRQWFEGMESARDMALGAMGSANPMGAMNPMNATGGASNPMAALMSNPMSAMMAAMGAQAGNNGADQGGVSGMTPATPPAAMGFDPGEAWRKWFEATAEAWQKSTDLGSEVLNTTPRWLQMIAQSRDNMMAAQSFPKDPLEFAVQWYNATSGPLSEFVQDVIEREEFLAQSSRFMRNYASLYKVFSRNNEQYLRFFQLPTRSDITRVASLIVGLEDKVDRLEEAFEDFEYGYAEPATAEAVGALDGRLAGIERAIERDAAPAEGIATAESVDGLASRVDRVEGKIDRVERKLDQLLSAIENVTRDGGAIAQEPSADKVIVDASGAIRPGGESTSGAGVRVTAAARRKAEELGVDLATVNGTGPNGQITVGDVRQKGDS